MGTKDDPRGVNGNRLGFKVATLWGVKVGGRECGDQAPGTMGAPPVPRGARKSVKSVHTLDGCGSGEDLRRTHSRKYRLQG